MYPSPLLKERRGRGWLIIREIGGFNDLPDITIEPLIINHPSLSFPRRGDD